MAPSPPPPAKGGRPSRQQSVSFADDEAKEPPEACRDSRGWHDETLEEGAAEGDRARVHLFLCCVPVPLMECARFVGWLSTVPLLISLFLLPFASSLLDLLPEVLLLGTELICVLSLFFGLQHQQPNYLRPFLFFGLIWNLALLLLLLFCVMELLIAPGRFCAQVALTLRALIHGGGTATASTRRWENFEEEFWVDNGEEEAEEGQQIWVPPARPPAPPMAAAWTLALSFVLLLAVTILINGWLLNIVLIAFLHMKKRQRRFVSQNCWTDRQNAGAADSAEQRQCLLTPPKKQKQQMGDRGHSNLLAVGMTEEGEATTTMFVPMPNNVCCSTEVAGQPKQRQQQQVVVCKHHIQQQQQQQQPQQNTTTPTAAVVCLKKKAAASKTSSA